jgi:hypothetical protein
MEVAYDGFFTAAVGGIVNFPAAIILDRPQSVTERQKYLQGSTSNVITLQGNAAGGFNTPGLPYQQG